MKSIIKLSLLAAVMSVVAAGSASADDQRLQDRQVRMNTQPTRTTTVAVYTNDRGVGRHVARKEQQEETRFELRSTAHGQVYGVYVAGQ
jgi:hypothetical protein